MVGIDYQDDDHTRRTSRFSEAMASDAEPFVEHLLTLPLVLKYGTNASSLEMQGQTVARVYSRSVSWRDTEGHWHKKPVGVKLARRLIVRILENQAAKLEA
jgi:hypothetical protein